MDAMNRRIKNKTNTMDDLYDADIIKAAEKAEKAKNNDIIATDNKQRDIIKELFGDSTDEDSQPLNKTNHNISPSMITTTPTKYKPPKSTSIIATTPRAHKPKPRMVTKYARKNPPPSKTITQPPAPTYTEPSLPIIPPPTTENKTANPRINSNNDPLLNEILNEDQLNQIEEKVLIKLKEEINIRFKKLSSTLLTYIENKITDQNENENKNQESKNIDNTNKPENNPDQKAQVVDLTDNHHHKYNPNRKTHTNSLKSPKRPYQRSPERAYKRHKQWQTNAYNTHNMQPLMKITTPPPQRYQYQRQHEQYYDNRRREYDKQDVYYKAIKAIDEIKNSLPKY